MANPVINFPDRVAIGTVRPPERSADPTVIATPEFLRSLRKAAELLAGVDPPVSGISVSDFTMLPVSSGGPASRRWENPNTNPNGWNNRSGMQTFKGKFTLNNYFAANPNGHFVIGLRCDTDVIATQPRFHGVACGNLTGAVEGCPFPRAMQIESRATGLSGATPPLRQLIPNAWSPKGFQLVDGDTYDLLVESKLIDSNRRAVRFVLSHYNAAVSEVGDRVFDLMCDTGDCLDPNTKLDMTKQGFVFASIFETATIANATAYVIGDYVISTSTGRIYRCILGYVSGSPATAPNLDAVHWLDVGSSVWSIDWFDQTVTWSSAPDCVTDDTVRMSRYQAEVEGDLTFVGNGRTIYVKCDGGTFTDWTAFVSKVANTPTTVLAKPNGTSQASAFTAADVSNVANAGSVASFGVAAGTAFIDTLGINGGTAGNIDFRINGTAYATVSTAGLSVNGALVATTTLKATTGFGCNGQAPQTAYTVPAAATDPATTMALVNAIRLALIADGICV